VAFTHLTGTWAIAPPDHLGLLWPYDVCQWMEASAV
jgi:hypothetical protein